MAKGVMVMAVFDGISGTYDHWYRTDLGNFVDQVETNLAFELFQPQKDMSVLDVGCGTGNFSQKLARKGCRVTGIDVSSGMLKKAKEKSTMMGLEIDYQFMDIYNLDFPDQSFDAVFSMAAFEFIEDLERAVQEMFRVTRMGGTIMVGTINGESSWGELYSSEESRKNSVFQYAHFKIPQDFKEVKKENLLVIRECLFTPPNTKEEELSMEKEQELSATERGGFFCVLWRR